MNVQLTSSDDIGTIESLRIFARQLRRKKDPASAITAGKIELAFSKALEELNAAKGDDLQPAESEA